MWLESLEKKNKLNNMDNVFLAKASLNSEFGRFNILVSENEINQINTLLGVDINQNNAFILKYKIFEYIQIVVTYLKESINSVVFVGFSMDNNIDLNKFNIYKFNINPQLSVNLSCLKQNKNGNSLLYKFFSIFEGVNLPKIHNYNINEHLNIDGVVTTLYTDEYLQSAISNIKYLKINLINNNKVLSLYFNEFAFVNTLKLFANKILSIHQCTDSLWSFNNIEKSIFLGNIIAIFIKSYLESLLNINFQIGGIEIKRVILSSSLCVNIENNSFRFPIYVEGFNDFDIQLKQLSKTLDVGSIVNADTVLSLGIDIGGSKISFGDLRDIKNGDVILLDEVYDKDIYCINLGKIKFYVKFNQDNKKLYFKNIEYV